MTTAKCWIKYHLYIYPLALPHPASFSPLGLIQLQSTRMLFQYFLCQSHILPLGQIMVLFSSTFPSWLLFLWQGASFPWLWIKALYASQLAQRWDSFICWLLSAGWVTSGKIAAFVCVSVCARVCVLWRCVTLAVHWDVFVSPGLLPAVSPYLWVTSTPDSFPDTGGITHDIKTPNPDATEPVENEPRAVTVSNVCSRLTELTCLSTHIDYFQLL